MDTNQLAAYLSRIGINEPVKPDLATLRRIQEQHLYLVPVENLDIIEGRLPLALDAGSLFDKVVTRRRGGISFELNLLLANALHTIGYGVTLLSAAHPRYGNELDHALLAVRIPDDTGTWIVDVGLPENFRTPLLFDARIWQSDGRDGLAFRADAVEKSRWHLVRRRRGSEEVLYTFTLKPREPKDYAAQCAWFCTDRRSRFTQGPYVSIERPEGRIRLLLDTLTNTYTGEQLRPLVETGEQHRAILREIFGLEPAGDEKFGGERYEAGTKYRRIFAAIDGNGSTKAVVERAVNLARTHGAHLRFGYLVEEDSKHDPSQSFPAYVQQERERVSADVAAQVAKLDPEGELYGGEVVVRGQNRRIGATIDAPDNFAPEQLVESIIRPFNPDLVICGASGKTKLQAFLNGSTSEHLKRALTCDIEVV